MADKTSALRASILRINTLYVFFLKVRVCETSHMYCIVAGEAAASCFTSHHVILLFLMRFGRFIVL